MRPALNAATRLLSSARPIARTARTVPTTPRFRPATVTVSVSFFGLFSTSAANNTPEMSQPKVQKSDSEWMAQLSPEQVRSASSMPGG